MKLLTSTSNYFHKPAHLLAQDREFMIDILMFWGFNDLQESYFTTAFDYFVANPNEYDGATASQDLYDIPSKVIDGKKYDGLEFAAMLHDWIYIVLRANKSVEAMRIADRVMKRVMKRMRKSGAEITWRLFRLAIVRRPFAIYNWWTTSKDIKTDVISIYEVYIAFAKA
jgi:hypothetical protein